jgi:hypothetical protein
MAINILIPSVTLTKLPSGYVLLHGQYLSLRFVSPIPINHQYVLRSGIFIEFIYRAQTCQSCNVSEIKDLLPTHSSRQRYPPRHDCILPYAEAFTLVHWVNSPFARSLIHLDPLIFLEFMTEMDFGQWITLIIIFWVLFCGTSPNEPPFLKKNSYFSSMIIL